jgi:SAM-dependent methyltransferase
MKASDKIDSKETGLRIGLILGKHLFRAEHLHYGYWEEGLEVELFNLPRAQEAYCDFLISHIPADAGSILDVGCGAGRLALQLLEKGYRVDCVSPSSVFARHTRDLLGPRSRVFECRYEDLQTPNRYDLILFSESFQYTDLHQALHNSVNFLNDNGYLFICDFFKKNVAGRSPISGGHRLEKFYAAVARHSLKQIRDLDITTQTAPTMDILNHILINVGQPILSLAMQYLYARHGVIARLLHWKFRKRIAKINRKYFSGTKNAANFSFFKSYRLLIYQKAGP